jgi:hypothetical protein
MWGLCVTEACNIHDHRYSVGGVEHDRTIADNEFRLNLRIIVRRGSAWFKALRYIRVQLYYSAVINLGWSSFAYNDKAEQNQAKAEYTEKMKKRRLPSFRRKR